VIAGIAVAIGAKNPWTICDVAVEVSVSFVALTTALNLKFATA
jgi:hypothetical protein